VLTFAQALARRALEHPARDAVRVMRGGRFDGISYGTLAERAAAIAAGLAGEGLMPGERVALFVRPGIDLIAMTYGLLHLGAVPVLIDPGMGRTRLLAAIERVAPVAMVGVARAQLARRLFPSAFKSLRLAVAAGPGPRLGALSLRAVESRGARSGREPFQSAPDDPAAVLFTSGSTGPPKGVVATHRNLDAQRAALQSLYDLKPGEINLACFPLFALFDTALGLTSLFPPIDPTRPARCNAARVVDTIERGRPTVAFGSPAIWRRIAPYCERTGRTLQPLARVLIAGAPVPPALVARLVPLLAPGGDVFTPFGATECLPVSSVSGAELLATRTLSEAPTAANGGGTNIGRPAPGTDVRIVVPVDGPIGHERDLVDAAPGALGEVLARGPQVTPSYLLDVSATQRAKVDGTAGLWHRMGDLGRKDADGRLWFCGRHAEALRTPAGLVPTTPVEAVADTLSGVHRTALVGIGPSGEQILCLVVELEGGRIPRGNQAAMERARITAHLEHAAPHLPQPAHIVFHRGFPVDVRHNAKIHRLTLAKWATRMLRARM